MFESMSDGVVVYNKQGQVLHTNAAARHIFGLGALPPQDEAHLRQELLLQAAQRNEQGQLLPEKRRPLARMLTGEFLMGTRASDVLVQTPDARQVVLNMSGAPIRSKQALSSGLCSSIEM